MPLSETRITVNNVEHWRRFFADETGAIDRCLEAMTVPYVDWLRRSMLEGFTTGEYVTGEASSSIYATEVRDEADGSVSIGVTTDLDYPWYWEFGFQHAGNGQYYRSPKFAPGLDATRPEMEAAWAAQMTAELSF